MSELERSTPAELAGEPGSAEPVDTPFGPETPTSGRTRTEVRGRFTTLAQERAKVLARRLGMRSHIALLFLIMRGEMARLDGQLDDEGRRLLDALVEEVLGPEDGRGPAPPVDRAALHVDGVTTLWRCRHGHEHPSCEEAALCRPEVTAGQ